MIYISEYSQLLGSLPVGLTAEQSFDVQIESRSSATFHASTRFILIKVTEPACIAFGPNPKASPEHHYLSSGETRIYPVNVGDRLAAISPLEG